MLGDKELLYVLLSLLFRLSIVWIIVFGGRRCGIVKVKVRCDPLRKVCTRR
jgi:hypothetical protein